MTNKILRINIGTFETVFEPLPPEWAFIGGRGLIAKILNREVPPDCNPLGPDNKLVITTGLLSGTHAPSCGRLSIGAKSPLTGGIKEANVGGIFARKLDRLGIRAIIIEGNPEKGKLYCPTIDSSGVQIHSAENLKGLKNYSLAEKLREKYGDNVTTMTIGPAGELKMKAASIAITDIKGVPCRHAARGGLGAVMGSKGIKAIVINDDSAQKIEYHDPKAFNQSVKKWVSILKDDITISMISQMGTPASVEVLNAIGSLPSKNYSSGTFADAQKLGGDAISKIVAKRGGRMHGCMNGCVVQCSITYNDEKGDPLTSALEYETLAMLGTNLGISNPDHVAKMDHMCDDIGVDTIEVGSSLGVAATADQMEFGNADMAIELIEEIGKGSEIGHAIGQGVVETCDYFNIKRVPAMKGQAIPGHDPRSSKGTGVTYCTSPMGADHTAGLTYSKNQSKEGQVKNSMRAQVSSSIMDCMGYCILAIPRNREALITFLSDAVNARYGSSLTKEDLVKMGKESLFDELSFNQKSDVFKKHEKCPQFIREESLAPWNTLFDVDETDLDTFWSHLTMDEDKEPPKKLHIYIPPEIIAGHGVLKKAGPILSEKGGNHPIIITDSGVEATGLVQTLKDILHGEGLKTTIFSDVEQDPPVRVVDKAAELYEKQRCNCIVAFGGGSSIDTAKALAVKVSHGGDLHRYDAAKGGISLIKSPLPFLMAIPTTSGTGSEVTPGSVLTDERVSHRKFFILHKSLIPNVAVIDSAVTLKLPPRMTALTGIDALAHCIEGYATDFALLSPLADASALYGIKLIGKSLRRAYTHGDDMDARFDMGMAACSGGISVVKTSGLAHAIGHTLTSWYHIPHG
ncbi:iron-containing alcohol dehydrogenase, partial [bacterium]|nr:iron-containing alcohol dehydrogenase [bacterium]